MSAKHKMLDAVTGVTNGPTLDLTKYDKDGNYPVQVFGITVGTVCIEGSFDGTNFSKIAGTEVTADGCFTIAEPYPYFRAAVTAYTSGTISVWIGTDTFRN